MPHTLALNIFAASFLEQTRAFLRLASAEHCIVHRPQNNQRMAGGCGFADDEFCDAVADELIPHPRISIDNNIEHYTNITFIQTQSDFGLDLRLVGFDF